jgi:hypothetical protein
MSDKSLMSTRYIATLNTPGYLPQNDDPPVFDTAREAWQYLVSEVERSWDDFPEDENGACIEAHTAMHKHQPGRGRGGLRPDSWIRGLARPRSGVLRHCV